MKRKLFLTITMLLCVVFVFAEAPFGIEFGWTLDDLTSNGIKFNNYSDENFVALLAPFGYYALPYYFADYDADGIYCVSCCSDDITTTTSEGTELWTYFLEVINDFNTFYGLPYMCVDYYSSKTFEKPSLFMAGLASGDIQQICVWFVDDLAVILRMYADSETTGMISCEIWRYKDIMDYFSSLKTELNGKVPQTKSDLPWEI